MCTRRVKGEMIRVSVLGTNPCFLPWFALGARRRSCRRRSDLAVPAGAGQGRDNRAGIGASRERWCFDVVFLVARAAVAVVLFGKALQNKHRGVSPDRFWCYEKSCTRGSQFPIPQVPWAPHTSLGSTSKILFRSTLTPVIAS